MLSEYWDVQTLSAYLNIKPCTLYAWAARGRIPCLKIHGLLRFHRNEIERWVESFRAQEPLPKLKAGPRSTGTVLDELIARAKGQAYNSRPRGNQTQSGPIGKERTDGAI